VSRSTTSRPLSGADYRALARFRRALRVFQRFSEEAARDAGLTPAQHQLLLAVRGHEGDGPPSTSDIAEALQLKLHSAGELAARAEGNGLVVRRDDPADARRTLLDLTSAGADALEALTLLHRDELRRFRAEMVDVLHELR
jgi:DNA-binding MarR family transcriptional regulator